MDGTVVVTGISHGIGRAVARAFAADGATVVGCGRDGDDLEAAVEAIDADTDTQVEGLRADVRDEYDVERLMETASRTGPAGIDIVIANAGVYHGDPGETPLDGESYATFDDHLRTNVRGVFATVREAAPHLNAGARVLIPTGAVARDPKPGIGSYAVSKAGAEALARGFAADLDATVGCVDPGQVSTDLSGSEGRDPDDVAGLFTWAGTEADPSELDGDVLGLREWRTATR